MARKKIAWCDEMADAARTQRVHGTQDMAAAIADLTGEWPLFDPYADDGSTPPAHCHCRCAILRTPSRWKFNLFWIAVFMVAVLATVCLGGR